MSNNIFTLLLAGLFFSCSNPGSNNSSNSAVDQKADTITHEQIETDKTVKFLWKAPKYDEVLKDTLSSIFINDAYAKNISDPERAALGYVATFIGSECNWDGDYTDTRSNLKCKVLAALDLGYQCSERHLGFLRQWFQNDPKVMEELKTENCPTIPDGSTSQSTFDEINITSKGNEIWVNFKATAVNLRAAKSLSWEETDHFTWENGHITLVKKDKS